MEPGTDQPEVEEVDRPLTRPAFLRAAALAVGGLAVAELRPRWAWAAATSEVASFVRLSVLVTGVENLPPALATSYLTALERAGLAMSPTRFLRLSGFLQGRGPRSLGGLRGTKAYRARGGRQVVDAIAAAWWSGMVPLREGGSRVVTYTDALVWKALPYAVPPSTCLGQTTAWSTPGRGLS